MTTAEAKTIKIAMSERRPIRIDPEMWPEIARAVEWDGQHRSQANRNWLIKVRQHANGRTIVYGAYTSLFQGERGSEGGYLLEAEAATTDEIVRSIYRVAGIIGRPEMAQTVISDLPEEEI